jgi:hypothetical protein
MRKIYFLFYQCGYLHKEEEHTVPNPKSSIEVTICTSSNILVWFGRDASEKGVAGLTESLISSLFAIAQGLEKYKRLNSRT